MGGSVSTISANDILLETMLRTEVEPWRDKKVGKFSPLPASSEISISSPLPTPADGFVAIEPLLLADLYLDEAFDIE
jgi:hypothetical protein